MSAYKTGISGKIQASSTSLAPVSVSKYQTADPPIIETKEPINLATNRTMAEEIARAAEHFVPKIRYSDTLSDYKEHALKLNVILKQISTNPEGLIDQKKKNDRDGFMAAINDYVLENVVPKKTVQQEEPTEIRTKYDTQLDPGLYLYQQEMLKIPFVPQTKANSQNQQYVSEMLANKPQFVGNTPVAAEDTFRSRFAGNKNEGYLQSAGYSAAPGSAVQPVRVNSQHIVNALSGPASVQPHGSRVAQPRSNSRSKLDDLMATVTHSDPSPGMMGVRLPKAQPISHQTAHYGPAPPVGANVRLNSQAILSSMAYTYERDPQTGGTVRRPPQNLPDMLQHPEKRFVPPRHPL